MLDIHNVGMILFLLVRNTVLEMLNVLPYDELLVSNMARVSKKVSLLVSVLLWQLVGQLFEVVVILHELFFVDQVPCWPLTMIPGLNGFQELVKLFNRLLSRLSVFFQVIERNFRLKASWPYQLGPLLSSISKQGGKANGRF